MLVVSNEHFIGHGNLIYERHFENGKLFEKVSPHHFGNLLDIQLGERYDKDNKYEL